MKMIEGMVGVIEVHYIYEYILTIITSTYGLVQEACFWFKEYIKTMTLKAVFKKCNTDTYLLYILNELRTTIVIIYVD